MPLYPEIREREQRLEREAARRQHTLIEPTNDNFVPAVLVIGMFLAIAVGMVIGFMTVDRVARPATIKQQTTKCNSFQC